MTNPLDAVNAEDDKVLPLVLAIAALEGIHPVRWCGGHTDKTLNPLTPASSTRYEGMHHPPAEPHEFWVEAMCDATNPKALESIYTLTCSLESEDSEDSILVGAPWEGLTLTISGRYDSRTPDQLAELLVDTTTYVLTDRQDFDRMTASVNRRINGFSQRKHRFDEVR